MLSDIDTHKIFYKKLQFVYLSMPKFTKRIDELETHFDKWLYVLKNLKRLDSIPDKLREKIFEKMFSVAEISKLNSEERRLYIDNLNSYRDLKNSLDYAEMKGKVEGLAEGEAKGKIEKALEVAKNLKALGMSFEQISEITKLSIEEIKNIFN